MKHGKIKFRILGEALHDNIIIKSHKSQVTTKTISLFNQLIIEHDKRVLPLWSLGVNAAI